MGAQSRGPRRMTPMGGLKGKRRGLRSWRGLMHAQWDAVKQAGAPMASAFTLGRGVDWAVRVAQL